MTNRRVSKERRRMEADNIAKMEFERDQFKIMYENCQIFECSHNLQHLPTCDGDCGITTLEGLDREICIELKKWDELGMKAMGTLPESPFPGIGVEIFHMELSQNTLVECLIEKGIFTREELDEKFKQHKLDRLVDIREMNEEQVKEARRRQQIAIGDVEPKLVVPPTRRTRMQ
jgi:hypothetical protein